MPPSEIAVPRPNVKGWRELQRALAALRTAITDQGANTTADPVDYTPTWTASVTDPVIGNGTLSGTYFRMFRSVQVLIYLLWGSTTTAGEGPYQFSLPVEPLTDQTWIGTGYIFDASASDYIVVPVLDLANLGEIYIRPDQNSFKVGSNVPLTWASGDEMALNIIYPTEPA